MTDSAYVRSLAATSRQRRRLSWSVILYAAVLFAGGAGLAVAARGGGSSGAMEWQLILLLRFMVLIKTAMVVGAVALAQWRLRASISDAMAFGLAAATATMALAPGLIWSMHYIIQGAVCFHAGLLAYLVLAWRDGSVRLPARRN